MQTVSTHCIVRHQRHLAYMDVQAASIQQIIQNGKSFLLSSWNPSLVNTPCLMLVFDCDDSDSYIVGYNGYGLNSGAPLSIFAPFGNLTKMDHIELSGRLLVGTVPKEWSGMTSLTAVSLDGNSLTVRSSFSCGSTSTV
jgi:hypothetical protein